MLTADSPQVVRAMEIIAPWLGRPGVIGAYLTGSATRPFFDQHSDLDLIVVAEDEAYNAMNPAARSVLGIDRGPPRRAEYGLLVRSWGDLVEMRFCDSDWFRYPYRFAHVLHESSGRLTEAVRAIAELPDAIREERLRTHYLEYLSAQKSASKCLLRQNPVAAHMMRAIALTALTKCLFLALGAWVVKAPWAMQELRASGVPEEIVSRIEAAWMPLEIADDAELKTLVGEWFVTKGISFHQYALELASWGVTEAGLAAAKRWIRTF